MNDIVKVENSGIDKIDKFTTLSEMRSLAQVMIDSGMAPKSLKTPEAVISVILLGRDLGFGAATSINNINQIQGRSTLSIHAITAKLLQKGIKFKTIKDFEPVKGMKDGKEVTVDYATTIRFYSPLEFAIDGEMYLTEDTTFSWSMASQMGLTGKENWVKMKKIMLWTRCMSLGARRVAGDFILGMYETSEWSDVVGQNYKMHEDGEVEVIN